jgi:leucyl-tRNA synthetase
MILGEDGQKMSKSRGNVINPDEIIEEFGADAFRIYEMFLGPLDKAKPWNKKGLYGSYRFIERLWKLFHSRKEKQTSDLPKKETTQLLHQTIKKVTDDIEKLRLNTAISQMMIFQNHLSSLDKVNEEIFGILLRLLSPFLPHMCEEVNSLWGGKDSIAYAAWPEYNEDLAKVDEVEIAVQINGKLRSTLIVSKDSEEVDVINQVKQIEKIIEYLNKGELTKTVYIPNRLVNFVIKSI